MLLLDAWLPAPLPRVFLKLTPSSEGPDCTSAPWTLKAISTEALTEARSPVSQSNDGSDVRWHVTKNMSEN
jgi:hypothetical protein